jgi:ATP-dependent DNA ligase
MGHIQQDLMRYGDRETVYDGELYSHEVVTQKGFPYLIGLLKRQDWDPANYSPKERQKISDQLVWKDLVQLHIFDCVSKTDWDTETNNETLLIRLSKVKAVTDKAKKPNPATSLVYVPHEEVNTIEEVESINGLFIADGYEGSMLKDPEAPYKFKRSHGWLKYKHFQTEEYEITGYYPGEGKWSGTLGGLTMKTTDEHKFRCGGGRISKKERDELWDIIDTITGKKATVRFFELTPDGIPRFPVFIIVRDYE